MARRERFTTQLKCPTCERTGTAAWEENENQVHAGGNLGTVLRSVSVGFRAAVDGVYCEKCDVKVVGR